MNEHTSLILDRNEVSADKLSAVVIGSDGSGKVVVLKSLPLAMNHPRMLGASGAFTTTAIILQHVQQLVAEGTISLGVAIRHFASAKPKDALNTMMAEV